MGKRSGVFVRDRGLTATLAALGAAKDLRVKVGILPGAPRQAAPGEDDAPTMVEVATANEFGTDRIPERSFIRATVDGNRRQIDQLITAVTHAVVDRKIGAVAALHLVGQKVEEAIKQRIVDLDSPPNAPMTIAQKGSDNPLIATGQLHQAISYKVTKKGADS